MTNSKSKIKKKNNKIVCATVFPNHFLIKKKLCKLPSYNLPICHTLVFFYVNRVRR